MPVDPAVTVTWFGPVGVPVLPVGLGVPPPQPAIDESKATLPSKETRSPRVSRLRRRPVNHANKSASAVVPANLRVFPREVAFLTIPDGAVVVIVNVDVAPEAVGVTEAGEKLQLASAGRPEQENVTGRAYPPVLVAVKVAVPCWPCAMLRAMGFTPSEKSGVGTLRVKVAAAVTAGTSESNAWMVKE